MFSIPDVHMYAQQNPRVKWSKTVKSLIRILWLVFHNEIFKRYQTSCWEWSEIKLLSPTTARAKGGRMLFWKTFYFQ